MKDMIKNYYGLNINDIHLKNDIYYFDINNIHFMFIEISDYNINIENMYEVNRKLYYNGIYMNRLVMNLFGNYETMINNKKYIMFCINENNRDININDILNFGKQNHVIEYVNNWHDLWCQKIDYYEYQMNQFGYKYPILRESFSYVVGLAEIAIMLINTVDFKNTYNCFMHKRISKDLYGFYCPLNVLVDSRIRDIAEYFKILFFKGKNDVINELNMYFNHANLTMEEYKLLFCRLLFITPYFDLYEDIMNDKIEEKSIKKIIQYLNDYEICLKTIYKSIKQYTNIDEIHFFTL